MKTHPILLFSLACVATALAVDPPPDGGYLNGNTAEGQDALFSLTTGSSNVAIGLKRHSSITGRKHRHRQ